MHDHSLSQFGTDTSIKNGGINPVAWAKTDLFFGSNYFSNIIKYKPFKYILFLGSIPVVGFGVILAFLIGTWTATGVMATKWDVPVNMFDTW